MSRPMRRGLFAIVLAVAVPLSGCRSTGEFKGAAKPGSGVITCPACGKENPSWKSFVRHVKRKHEDMYCKKCLDNNSPESVWATQAELDQHDRVAHGTQAKKIAVGTAILLGIAGATLAIVSTVNPNAF